MIEHNFPYIKYQKGQTYHQWGTAHGEEFRDGIKELVEITGMSKSKLQRLFQSVYGTSVYQFIKSVRMEKAMGLLMSP